MNKTWELLPIEIYNYHISPCLIHNIKIQGKHLKKTKEVILFKFSSPIHFDFPVEKIL